MSIASDFLVPIRDGVLDTVGFGGAGKLADEFQCKGDSAAETVAGGDVPIHDDLFIVDHRTGKLVLEARMGGGVLPSSSPSEARMLGAAQMAATFLPALAKAAQVSVTVLLAARFGVPGMPPGSTTRSTSE